MDKENVIYTKEYCSAMKKKETSILGDMGNPEDVMPCEISQVQKDKRCMISFICGI